MARTTTLVSDLSNETLTDSTAARVSVTYSNGKVQKLDISEAEAKKLFGNNGKMQAKRGRKANPLAVAA